MRVTSNTYTNLIVASSQTAQQQLAQLQQEISTGNSIQDPSDDPTLYSQAAQDQNTLAQLGQYTQAAQTATTMTATNNQAMTSIHQIVAQAGRISRGRHEQHVGLRPAERRHGDAGPRHRADQHRQPDRAPTAPTSSAAPATSRRSPAAAPTTRPRTAPPRRSTSRPAIPCRSPWPRAVRVRPPWMGFSTIRRRAPTFSAH